MINCLRCGIDKEDNKFMLELFHKVCNACRNDGNVFNFRGVTIRDMEIDLTV